MKCFGDVGFGFQASVYVSGALVGLMKSVLWFRDSFGDDGKRREKVVGIGSKEEKMSVNNPRS